MWTRLRRLLNYFLIGFVITFVIYLFARYNTDEIVLGIVIGAVGGAVATIIIVLLERRFPDESPRI